MEFLVIFIVLILLIIWVLVSINGKLSMLVNQQNQHQPEKDDLVSDIRDELSEIKGILESIRYTTDIIENYQLPTNEERKMIDQIRVDQEIDAMIDSRKN